jgi:hypothetical protein
LHHFRIIIREEEYVSVLKRSLYDFMKMGNQFNMKIFNSVIIEAKGAVYV